ncbi:hypothetical protein [Chryseobacterium aquaeductus]|nr:hypothetical protein [Chryseobacterium aquaeductus]
MEYEKDNFARTTFEKGNYSISYQYHSNLKIKSKNEYIYAISRSRSFQVGIEKNYDEQGNLISSINWETLPYDENISAPKKNIWEIAKEINHDFNFDILNDKSLFGIVLFQDKKTGKVNYTISKFLGDDNDILKFETYEYDGENGKFVKHEKKEVKLPKGGLIHY